MLISEALQRTPSSPKHLHSVIMFSYYNVYIRGLTEDSIITRASSVSYNVNIRGLTEDSIITRASSVSYNVNIRGLTEDSIITRASSVSYNVNIMHKKPEDWPPCLFVVFTSHHDQERYQPQLNDANSVIVERNCIRHKLYYKGLQSPEQLKSS